MSTINIGVSRLVVGYYYTLGRDYYNTIILYMYMFIW